MSDQWVSATGEMSADDDIRGARSIYLTAGLFSTVDVAAALESLLPGPTSQLSGPLAATLQPNDIGLGARPEGQLCTTSVGADTEPSSTDTRMPRGRAPQ